MDTVEKLNNTIDRLKRKQLGDYKETKKSKQVVKEENRKELHNLLNKWLEDDLDQMLRKIRAGDIIYIPKFKNKKGYKGYYVIFKVTKDEIYYLISKHKYGVIKKNRTHEYEIIKTMTVKDAYNKLEALRKQGTGNNFFISTDEINFIRSSKTDFPDKKEYESQDEGKVIPEIKDKTETEEPTPDKKKKNTNSNKSRKEKIKDIPDNQKQKGNYTKTYLNLLTVNDLRQIAKQYKIDYTRRKNHLINAILTKQSGKDLLYGFNTKMTRNDKITYLENLIEKKDNK